MAKTTTINTRVDAELKAEVSQILADMGLTFSQAFTLMLHQIRIQRALPFEIAAYGHTPTSSTLAQIESIENGTAEMAGPFDTYEEYKAWLEEYDDDEDEI